MSTPHTKPHPQPAGVTFAKTLFSRLPHSDQYKPHKENTLVSLILVNTEHNAAQSNPKNTSVPSAYSGPCSGSKWLKRRSPARAGK